MQLHMCGPPPPPCNEERLRTIHALDAVSPVIRSELLDAPPDPEINSILKLVASIFEAPAALVALFDDSRIFIRDSEVWVRALWARGRTAAGRGRRGQSKERSRGPSASAGHKASGPSCLGQAPSQARS